MPLNRSDGNEFTNNNNNNNDQSSYELHQDYIEIFIDSLWISSCYLNSNVENRIHICLNKMSINYYHPLYEENDFNNDNTDQAQLNKQILAKLEKMKANYRTLWFLYLFFKYIACLNIEQINIKLLNLFNEKYPLNKIINTKNKLQSNVDSSITKVLLFQMNKFTVEYNNKKATSIITSSANPFANCFSNFKCSLMKRFIKKDIPIPYSFLASKFADQSKCPENSDQLNFIVISFRNFNSKYSLDHKEHNSFNKLFAEFLVSSVQMRILINDQFFPFNDKDENNLNIDSQIHKQQTQLENIFDFRFRSIQLTTQDVCLCIRKSDARSCLLLNLHRLLKKLTENILQDLNDERDDTESDKKININDNKNDEKKETKSTQKSNYI
jgi:hypothetical protein